MHFSLIVSRVFIPAATPYKTSKALPGLPTPLPEKPVCNSRYGHPPFPFGFFFRIAGIGACFGPKQVGAGGCADTVGLMGAVSRNGITQGQPDHSQNMGHPGFAYPAILTQFGVGNWDPSGRSAVNRFGFPGDDDFFNQIFNRMFRSTPAPGRFPGPNQPLWRCGRSLTV